MRKKTIPVAVLVSAVNERNATSTCGPDERKGWNSLLEHVLFATGQYAGFRYLNQTEVPPGHLPGFAGADAEPRFPDETRRQYGMKS